jgi:hypothetical protein
MRINVNVGESQRSGSRMASMMDSLHTGGNRSRIKGKKRRRGV